MKHRVLVAGNRKLDRRDHTRSNYVASPSIELRHEQHPWSGFHWTSRGRVYVKSFPSFVCANHTAYA